MKIYTNPYTTTYSHWYQHINDIESPFRPHLSEVRQTQGLLRIVFGLATQAMDIFDIYIYLLLVLYIKWWWFP